MTKALTTEDRGKALRTLFEGRRDQIQAALPRHVPADLMIRSVLTQLATTPRLLECTQSSVYLCVMHMAQLGLRCGPERLAYLIPFRNSKKNVTECQLMIGYPGLLKLVRQSGQVLNVVARAVYEADDFLLEYGLEEKLVHRPILIGTRGELMGVYAVATMRDGVRAFDFMTRVEVEERRKASKSKDSDAWRLWYDEMAKKTVLRRLCKALPMDTEDHLHAAIVIDGQADAGVAQDLMPLGGSDTIPDGPILVPELPVPVTHDAPAPKPAPKPEQQPLPTPKQPRNAERLSHIREFISRGVVTLSAVQEQAGNLGHTGDLEKAPAKTLDRLIGVYERMEGTSDEPDWARETKD